MGMLLKSSFPISRPLPDLLTMEEIRILIVEDEMIIANDIAAHLSDLGLVVKEILGSGEEVLAYLETESVHIVLMDIALDGAMDGIDTAQAINRKYKIPIIYLTANIDDRTFARAKATRPFDFIEKPFKKRSLIRSIELLIESMLRDQSKRDMDSIILTDRIFVRDKSGLQRILLKDILYIEAERAYCKIFTNEKHFLLSNSLGQLEQRISEAFLRRVHRSFMVNLTKISRIEDGMVVVGGKAIPVSRSHWDDLSNSLQII